MDEFLLALENLITHEANNGDYYLEGYVDGGELADLINKFFPEREFTHHDTYCRWYGPRPKRQPGFIPDIYGQAIVQQLAKEAGFMKRLFKED
jgi:hypothetical protein